MGVARPRRATAARAVDKNAGKERIRPTDTSDLRIAGKAMMPI